MARATAEYIFQTYKNRLMGECKVNEGAADSVRFICVEYLCRFPKIDPYKMAATLKSEGIAVLFDDSSISAAENRRKEKKVEQLSAAIERHDREKEDVPDPSDINLASQPEKSNPSKAAASRVEAHEMER